MYSYIRSLWLIAALVLAVYSHHIQSGNPIHNYCDSHHDQEAKPRTCLDLMCRGEEESGVYKIYPKGRGSYSFDVFCDQKTNYGGWTVFQRRMDGSVDFYRNWQNYKLGFGDVNAEHWLGNDKISLLLSLNQHTELWVDLEAVSNERAYARYVNFSMGDESTGYTLSLSGYSGTAGDSMSHRSGYRFSTLDRDNDSHSINCAARFKGAWWYTACSAVTLNGLYLNGRHDRHAEGVSWYTWTGNHESLKTTEMKFRVRLA